MFLSCIMSHMQHNLPLNSLGTPEPMIDAGGWVEDADDLRIHGLHPRSLTTARVNEAVARVDVSDAILVRSRAHANRVEKSAIAARKRFVARPLPAGAGFILTCIGTKPVPGYRTIEGLAICESCLHLRHEQCMHGQRYSLKRSPIECQCVCERQRRPWVDLRDEAHVPLREEDEGAHEKDAEEVLGETYLAAAGRVAGRSGRLAGAASVDEVLSELNVPVIRRRELSQGVGRVLRAAGWSIWQPRENGKQLRLWRKRTGVKNNL